MERGDGQIEITCTCDVGMQKQRKQMGEKRKTRKLIYVKLPCVGGSNLPSVKSLLSESLSLQMGYCS